MSGLKSFIAPSTSRKAETSPERLRPIQTAAVREGTARVFGLAVSSMIVPPGVGRGEVPASPPRRMGRAQIDIRRREFANRREINAMRARHPKGTGYFGSAMRLRSAREVVRP